MATTPLTTPTWSFIVDRYVGGLKDVVKSDLSFLAEHPFVALVMVGGTMAVALLRPAGPPRTLIWAAVPAAFAYVLIAPNNTEFRLELAFLPLAALGLGATAARLERPLA